MNEIGSDEHDQAIQRILAFESIRSQLHIKEEMEQLQSLALPEGLSTYYFFWSFLTQFEKHLKAILFLDSESFPKLDKFLDDEAVFFPYGPVEHLELGEYEKDGLDAIAGNEWWTFQRFILRKRCQDVTLLEKASDFEGAWEDYVQLINSWLDTHCEDLVLICGYEPWRMAMFSSRENHELQLDKIQSVARQSQRVRAVTKDILIGKF